MFQTKRLQAEYKEKINHKYVEDIRDHALEDYFKGFVVFSYDSIHNKEKTINSSGIHRTIKQKIMKTKSALPFKNGDIIRLYGKELYRVDEVSKEIPEKFVSLVASNPGVRERYEINVLVLYEQ